MAARLSAKEGSYVVVILPSGELRRIHHECRATIGRLGNLDHQNVRLGKAGRKRHRGRRPHVRGVAQNPIAHPMGGGEGRSGGGRHPCSPWGKLSKGAKTRKKNKTSDQFIIRRRSKR
jgi:large subunit ribosomal protein L2